MGEVFLAYDPRLERQVAIKRIRPARPRPEPRAVPPRGPGGGALAHPAIVQVYDLLSEDGLDYIVMEYVEGRKLRTRPPGPLAARRLWTGALALDRGLA